MSIYQLDECLFDDLRALEDTADAGYSASHAPMIAADGESTPRTGEICRRVTVAGAMYGHKAKSPMYEPSYEWITGMGIILHVGDAR